MRPKGATARGTPTAAGVLLVLVALFSLPACGEKEEAGAGAGEPATTTEDGGGELSPVRREFEAELRRTLPEQQNLRGAQIECVLERLRQTVTDAQLEDVTSPVVAREVARASVGCAGVPP